MIKRIQGCTKVTEKKTLEGVIQMDETFVGGKNKNRHKNKKVKNSQGRSFKDKTPVFGMINDAGIVITKVVKNTSEKSLMPIIKDIVKKGSTIYTDEWGAYRKLDKDYIHGIIMHCIGQYINGNIHTNEIEGYWSHLKRGI